MIAERLEFQTFNNKQSAEDLATLTFLSNHVPRYLKDSLWTNASGFPPTKNPGKLDPGGLKCTTSDLAVLMTTSRCFLRA
eukprot:1160206-Pelagomonas_calceolata.AAC.9